MANAPASACLPSITESQGMRALFQKNVSHVFEILESRGYIGPLIGILSSIKETDAKKKEGDSDKISMEGLIGLIEYILEDLWNKPKMTHCHWLKLHETRKEESKQEKVPEEIKGIPQKITLEDISNKIKLLRGAYVFSDSNTKIEYQPIVSADSSQTPGDHQNAAALPAKECLPELPKTALDAEVRKDRQARPCERKQLIKKLLKENNNYRRYTRPGLIYLKLRHLEMKNAGSQATYAERNEVITEEWKKILSEQEKEEFVKMAKAVRESLLEKH